MAKVQLNKGQIATAEEKLQVRAEKLGLAVASAKLIRTWATKPNHTKSKRTPRLRAKYLIPRRYMREGRPVVLTVDAGPA